MAPHHAVGTLKTVEKRMSKVKRKNIGNAGSSILDALRTASREAGYSVGSDDDDDE
eukprot:CAMPEP_0173395920 /NCGR_PEP_ID=MMETSP1356-20130122/33810_1 /TAXON_ID=77927 ORGANISM="Hemiselmis virescens, Strain PCC157" /NCGR_SAMPLE_ID=MMETSP1356 /ASSEMBLY_ACC=CAM_ASM_000847 /LENGTH=55 /DNA_ID=CAMNT_0014354795 /DNA_START=30 /DNA_END=197 /DNA_ORIENTATION=+